MEIWENHGKPTISTGPCSKTTVTVITRGYMLDICQYEQFLDWLNVDTFCMYIVYIHMLHVWNIKTTFAPKSPSFVGKYTSTMEHMCILAYSPNMEINEI